MHVTEREVGTIIANKQSPFVGIFLMRLSFSQVYRGI